MALLLSVALCTCNGADFLPAQLDSILAQRRLPDELVVGDDRSTDGTMEILAEFRARAPFPVRLHQNASRLGVAGNFESTIRRATGQLIATCDQDDVWHEDRLAQAEQAFGDPEVMLTFSDAELVDAELKPLGATLWRTLGVTDDLGRLAGPGAFSALLRRRAVTGATMTIRASLLERALPIGDAWIHDEWLSVFAAVEGRLVAIPEPLVRYRQHARNVIGAKRSDFIGRFAHLRDPQREHNIAHARRQLVSLRSALAVRPECPPSRIAELDRRIAHLDARLALPSGLLGRGAGVLKELRTGRYSLNAYGHWSALRDLVG